MSQALGVNGMQQPCSIDGKEVFKGKRKAFISDYVPSLAFLVMAVVVWAITTGAGKNMALNPHPIPTEFFYEDHGSCEAAYFVSAFAHYNARMATCYAVAWNSGEPVSREFKSNWTEFDSLLTTVDPVHLVSIQRHVK